MYKLQTQVLLIAVKTLGVFLGDAFSWLGFVVGQQYVLGLAMGWSQSRGAFVLLFQPLFSFQVMPYCIRPSQEICDRYGGIIFFSLQNNVEV